MDFEHTPPGLRRFWSRPALLARTFRSLKHRNYRLYFIGQLVSFTGSWMQSAALMWLAYDLTSDPFWPPLMLVAAVGPTLVLGPIGGALADHLPKKWLVFGTQCSFLFTSLLLIAALVAGIADPGLLLAIQLLNGLVQSIDLPARLSFVPDLIPKEDLVNAVGLNSLTFNLARAIGPAFAGIFFAAVKVMDVGAKPVFVGAIACFAVNAVSYVAVLIALARISVGGRGSSQRHSPVHFWYGVAYIIERPGLAGLIVLTGLFSVFAWPVLTLLPAYTTGVLGQREEAYSFLVSALGGGALTGSLTTATFGSPRRSERFLLMGVFFGVIGIGGLLVAKSLALAFVATGIFGFGLILYLSTGQSTLQLRSPEAGRGKVMALWAMTLSGSSIPGHLLAGQAARVFPLDQVLAALLLGVAATALGLVILIASGRLRK